MSINKLLDVEEHVWSPMFGLKGNIDATVQVVMRDGGEEKTFTVPFEVKTGRNNSNASHNAQTALYTLLLSDRYGQSIGDTILGCELTRLPQMLILPTAYSTTSKRPRSRVSLRYAMNFDIW
jgi:CRISPR/Cas system-associated exonuclease Cas4 (RecB family)